MEPNQFKSQDTAAENFRIQEDAFAKVHVYFLLNQTTDPDGEIHEIDIGPEDMPDYEDDDSCRVYLGTLALPKCEETPVKENENEERNGGIQNHTG